ncbi:MAG: protein-glutamate O-methyltransferase [Coriobacteriia bacterium]|nr:protein-glutamate O-methyltransferase [Coriobacteriia bacterium]
MMRGHLKASRRSRIDVGARTIAAAFEPQEMSERDYATVAAFVERVTGIRMPPHKRTMAQARLAKRVRALGLSSFEEYVEYTFNHEQGFIERMHLIDLITTNTTDFFREADHFEYLRDTAIPLLRRERPGIGERTPVHVWSAACSTGEEAYSIAVTLAEVARQSPPFSFEVVGTDICSRALETARRAVYAEDRIAPVAVELRKRYFLRSKDRSSGQVRVCPELRSTVRFGRFNLLSDPIPWEHPMDIVFCRNVLIYFDQPVQAQVVRRLARAMRPGGFLFIGHSETLNALDVPFVQAAPTVYRRA